MKLAVVGTSWITDSFLESCTLFEEITLEAVMSRRQTSVDTFIDKYGFKKGYTDFDELCNDPDIELIYIASPNSFHFDQTKKALLSQKHVICEKPITLSLDELNELEQISISQNVFFIEAMRPVHHPHMKVVKESLKLLDSIKYATFRFMRYSSKYDAYKRGENPRVFTTEFGGGALNDLGVYPITTAVMLFGEPDKVTVDSITLDTGVDATTRITLYYGDVLVNCQFSKVSNSYLANEIQGEANTLLLSHVTHLDKLILKDDNSEQEIFNTRLEKDMQYEIKAIINIIKENNIEEFNRLLTITKQVTVICDEIRKHIGGKQNETKA